MFLACHRSARKPKLPAIVGEISDRSRGLTCQAASAITSSTMQETRSTVVPRIAYRVTLPANRSVVLLHGVGSSSATWATLLPLLPGELAYVAPDLRGHGHSDGPAGPYSLTDLVDDHVRVLDELELDTAHLVGFSLGAVIAHAIALAHPERVASLVLLNAATGRTEEERLRALARLHHIRAHPPAEIARASVERWFTAEFAARHPDLVAAEVAIVSATRPAPYAAAYEVLATSDLLEETSRITCPALVVTGELDGGSTPRMSHELHARLAHSEQAILPGLRHYLHIEAAPKIAELVGGFLRRHAGDPPPARPDPPEHHHTGENRTS